MKRIKKDRCRIKGNTDNGKMQTSNLQDYYNI